jgi:hypothetical protein
MSSAGTFTVIGGALGWSVGAGDRDPERQQVAVAKLPADGADAFPVPST